jgi:DNA replication and repair protein RecF
MLLTRLRLQNFRNYKDSNFLFDKTTIFVGRNTIGKTNILEAISFLSTGKSFRAEQDKDAIKEGEDFSRIEAEVIKNDDKINLTAILHIKTGHLYKKFLVNTIAKRQTDFVSNIVTVLFTPSDIEIVTDSPTLRRKYLDSVLSQAKSRYRIAHTTYERALKQRNKLLYLVREGKRLLQKNDFEYWDSILIENGDIITRERNDYISFINKAAKNTFNFSLYYDKSTITQDRLEKYFETELQAGVTLVGPQRDDIVFRFPNTEKKISEFGSRGEQRLTVLQTKLIEIEYLHKSTETTPVLLLDDVFSELDSENIAKILEIVPNQQTLITTTHKEFIPKNISDKVDVIDLSLSS